MKKSPFYTVITQPNLIIMVPRTYLAMCLPVSFIFGGGLFWFFTGKAIFMFVGAAILGGILWAVGALKTIKDPEFFDVWYINRFKMNVDSPKDGNTYEP